MGMAQSDHFICKDIKLMEEKMDFRASPFTQNYDLKYHRMEWMIDPGEYFIAGTVTTYFVPTEDDFNEISFDLATVLDVSEVLYHGQTLNFQQLSGNQLKISLPNPLSQGQLDSVSITYEGEPPSSGFGSFGQGTHNGVPALWTLSEPYGAKDWWPCKQDLVDKIDSIDVYVRTPDAYRAASNGLLVGEWAEGNDKVYHWKHRYPIPAYLIAIAVTNYEVYSDFVQVDGGDDIEVLNYVFPEDLNYAQNSTGATVACMELFNDLYGLYPFAEEKYGHAQFGWGGGMEHQTMSFMGGFSHSLQAHELAHQWFGDKVTCGSWADIWLNEGFATYSEGLTYNYGLTSYNFKNWVKSKIDHVTSQPDGSVYVYDTTNVGRIFSGRLSYSKGAMLLHMLRWKLGDDDYFQALRNYLNDPELAFGYARTNDLQYHLEAVSGQDLNEFFDDWLYGEGYPSYTITWGQDELNKVYVEIAQTTSHSSVDFFEMPVPILFEGIFEDSLVVLNNTAFGQGFQFDLPFEINKVTFDPDYWIVSKGNTVQEVFVSSNEKLDVSETLQLFPNPAKDQLWVKVTGAQELPNAYELLSLNGQRVDAGNWNSSFNFIDVSQLQPGHYLARFTFENGVAVKKFVVE
jgi:aminopeptidase N